MPTRDEQIGKRAGDNEAMSVLFEPAIAHLGKAEHPLDDPDGMLDFGPHLRFGAVLRALDRVHGTPMAVAAVDEVPCSRRNAGGSRRVDHDTPGRPTRGFRCRATNRGSTVLSVAGVATTAWISLLRLSTPK